MTILRRTRNSSGSHCDGFFGISLIENFGIEISHIETSQESLKKESLHFDVNLQSIFLSEYHFNGTHCKARFCNFGHY